MRDQWFSDNRDLIKWSVLLLLARQSGASRVVQIALLNPSDYGQVEIDGKSYDIPSEVLSCFRDIRTVTDLSHNPRISVFDAPFQNRGYYLSAALDYVASFGNERCVVFLDPDTGLEPNGGGDTKHVLEREARQFWTALPAGSLFVFYQHETNKAGKPWIEEKRKQLARAISIPVEQIRTASGPKIARDVVFFFAAKE